MYDMAPAAAPTGSACADLAWYCTLGCSAIINMAANKKRATGEMEKRMWVRDRFMESLVKIVRGLKVRMKSMSSDVFFCVVRRANQGPTLNMDETHVFCGLSHSIKDIWMNKLLDW